MYLNGEINFVAQVDKYGTQQPIALLKLLLERGGMYDRGKDLNWKNMKDIGYIAAMGKAGGGRNETDPRFVSLFCVFNMTFPSEDALFLIYNSILAGHTQPFPKEIQDTVPTLTKMTMALYRYVLQAPMDVQRILMARKRMPVRVFPQKKD